MDNKNSVQPKTRKEERKILRSQQNNSKTENDNNQNGGELQPTILSNVMMLPEGLAKGYLSFDPTAKDLLQSHLPSLENNPHPSFQMEEVSAKNYVVLNRHTLAIVAEREGEEQIEIASLTKIMTFYLSLMVCRKYSICPKNIVVRVSDRAERVPGTSAKLQAGDLLSLHDLFYGLMLPSGNDASIAIAETIGKIIQATRRQHSRKTYY
jgi:D-alanyl-D-alanine carboxypeptidase